MSEQNKARSRKVFEDIQSDGKLDVIREVWAEDAVSEPMGIRGWEGIKQLTQMLRTAFPDLTITVDEQLAEGNSVANRVTYRGTHEGLLLGQYAATGKPVVFTALAIHHHENGKIVRGYGIADIPSLLEQIGAAPGNLNPQTNSDT